MIVRVNGTEQPYQLGSPDLDNAIGQRSICSFSIVDKEGVKNFQKGQPVEIYDDDGETLLFSGFIDRPVSSFMSLAGNYKIHEIDCVDWHQRADKRIIAKVYRDMTAGAIVRDIIDNYLSSEGIKPGNIEDGPDIIEAIFNYIYIADAFESVAEKAGFAWVIDENRELHFFANNNNIAPHELKEISDYKNLKVEPASEDYRNKQYIRAGKDITDPQIAEFVGDGRQYNFTVGYDLALEPKVWVNDVPQTVGISGVEENTQWYWNKGERVVSQDKDAPRLTNQDVIKIEFQGMYDIVVLSYDNNAIEDRKLVEGGTGVYENVADEPELTTRMSAFQAASSKLQRFAKMGTRVTFETKLNGFKPGQLLNVDLPSFGINETDFLIESVKASEIGSINISEDGTYEYKLTYQVSCVDGAATGGWANFFKKMAQEQRTHVIYENIQEDEVLILLETFNKTWSEWENPNIFKELFPHNELSPDENIYPSFGDEERVKYIAFYDENNNEFFRKHYTKQTKDSKRIVTTTSIMPQEANNKQITAVGWFGGDRATKIKGSGTLVDKQTFDRFKTNSEIIQIDKIDTKGW